MSAFSIRNALPVVTSVVSALFLVTAGSHESAPQPSASSAQIAQAEVQHCVANGRDFDDCLDEADGKALVERADWLARNDDAARRARQP
jgi:hypothetical protein